MRITEQDLRLMRETESEILDGRRCNAGGCYLEKRILTAEDGVTHVKTYRVELEMVRPAVRILTGNEKEVIGGGMTVVAGDIICVFPWNKNLFITVAPDYSDLGYEYYYRVNYLDDYYLIIKVLERGMGHRPNRKLLYASLEV